MSSIAEAITDRQIIGRDTPILDGVYFAHFPIVVDYAENPEPYEKLYEAAVGGLDSESNLPTELRLVRRVGIAVDKAMLMSLSGRGEVLKGAAEEWGVDRIGMEHPMPLSSFIEAGVGKCHELTLATGAVLDLAKRRHDLPGVISIERANLDPRSHNWVYYGSDSLRYFLDVAYARWSFVGDKKQADWRMYLRPEDRMLSRILRKIVPAGT